MIAILVICVSCEKDPTEPEPDFPTEITSAADLDGTWEFVNLHYESVSIIDFTT